MMLFTAHNLCTPNRIVDLVQLFRVFLSNVFLVLLKLSVLPSHRSAFFCGGVSTALLLLIVGLSSSRALLILSAFQSFAGLFQRVILMLSKV